ncbi:crotonase/enoyl-CoA hydratase family protein [Nocardia salmonicida]|uniref:crotonase/enoyl-CoA hydratase family protein n=1 Tax=Nocardia salmonicida TaxID=53431 RepID=UPI0033F8D2C8
MPDERDLEDLVLFHRDGPVAIITINRPAAMNAINSAVADAIGTALDEMDSDPALHVGIITGAGRAFCAGADLKAFASGHRIDPTIDPEWGFAGLVQHQVSKPLIAAVNGFALGGGTEIVLACDLAVISADAQLGLPEVRRGLVAAAGGVFRLPDQIPAKVAAHAIYTGSFISPETALHWGLVNAVTPPAEVIPRALEIARTIAANAPLAVRASKRMMSRRHDVDGSAEQARWKMNHQEMAAIRGSHDFREGTRAFSEKRAPLWQGR